MLKKAGVNRMRKRFEEELEALNEELVKMGTIVEQAIALGTKAILEQDGKVISLVRELEEQTNEMEKQIESRALRIILSQQPVARDLRLISTALKMIRDMERIGDQALDISEIAVHFEGKTFIKKPVHIMMMSEQAVKMVNQSVDAFVKHDIDLAQQVISADDIIDDLFVTVRQELIDLIRDNPDNGEQAMDFMMVAKYLERIGDHAVNIAEWVIFHRTGLYKDQKSQSISNS